MKNRGVWIVALSVLLLTQLPYFLAAQPTGSGAVFGGFLLNPIDGNSYLAKMYEGWSGTWQFRLPYTAGAEPAGYLFLFYILLGHIARWLGLSLLLTFHLARGLATLGMVWMLARFWRSVFPDPEQSRLAFLLSTLGAGLGWLVFPFLSRLPPDFWIAEAYPFLSAYANPHFPLAIAIMLWIFSEAFERKVKGHWWGAALASLCLGMLLPFSVVIVCGVLALFALWNRLEGDRLDWFSPLVAGIGGAVPLLYELYLTRVNSSIAAWNAQNVTPAPSLIEFAIGFLPALVAAGFGLRALTRHPGRDARFLLAWALVGVALTYVPFSLQRRFMVAWMAPAAGLAAIGIACLRSASPRWGARLRMGVMVASFLTPLLIIFSATQAVRTQDPAIYLYPGERQVLDWIGAHTPASALVLASPDTGLLIPAYTGRQVIYGHPFETIDADRKKAITEDLFRGTLPAEELSTQSRTSQAVYLIYGPREAKIGKMPVIPGMTRVYAAAGFQIYSLGG